MAGFFERLQGVQRRIEAACSRSGRKTEDVTVVCVAKTYGPEQVCEAAECGVAIIGESKVQEARAKIPLCPGSLEWHMIGHLQRNKVREAVSLFTMVHSVDSWKLLETLDAAAREEGKTIRACLEVNVSGERSKFGMPPDEVPSVLERCGKLMSVDVVGLMTMPPFSEDPEEARPFFKALRERRDQWQRELAFPLPGLSMGMSHDFEIAVEEGATWVRLGTILFGERPKKTVEISE